MNVYLFGEQYFQNQEQSLFAKILIAFVGAFFGFGFSLSIYYLKTRQDKRKEEKERISRLKNVLIYYGELISSIIKSFNQELVEIDDFLAKQRKNLSDILILRIVSTNDFIRLRSIDSKGIFEAWSHFFKEADAIHKYKQANSSSDFLDGTLDEIKRMSRSNMEECFKRLLVVKEIIDHIPDRLSSIAMNLQFELKDERFKSEVYVFINSHIQKYLALIKEESNFRRTEAEFIKPLLEGFVAKYKEYPFADEIIILCKKVRVKLNDVEREMEATLSEFQKVRERTKKSLERLATVEKQIFALRESES
jgi:hypothetical protein